jgi:hypothetical protein
MSDTGIDIARYTYRVTWSAEDDEYVATCPEFGSLSWLAATQEDARCVPRIDDAPGPVSRRAPPYFS